MLGKDVGNARIGFAQFDGPDRYAANAVEPAEISDQCRAIIRHRPGLGVSSGLGIDWQFAGFGVAYFFFDPEFGVPIGALGRGLLQHQQNSGGGS